MMILAFVKKGSHEFHGDVILQLELSGSTLIVTSSCNQYCSGWKRIPLSRARAMCKNNSAKWISPQRSSQGLEKLKEIEEKRIENFCSYRQKEEKKGIIITDYEPKNKTLLDAEKIRKNRERWRR